LLQVIGITGWNKNLVVEESAAGCAQDVFEAEAALVGVPGAQRRSGDRAATSAFDEPEGESGIEVNSCQEIALANLGTRKNPAIVRVQTMERAQQVAELCDEHAIHFILGLEPDEPEDISDILRALDPPAPVLVQPKVGRNEPCPCGSGKKFKKCCDAPQDSTTTEPVATNSRWPAIGLLAVHAAIALADAILVATEGSRSKSENHRDAGRRLRDWCSAKRLEAGGAGDAADVAISTVFGPSKLVSFSVWTDDVSSCTANEIGARFNDCLRRCTSGQLRERLPRLALSRISALRALG
jgi:SWIM/SEC-C metal-binding protein